ncbi:hypothetical protein ABZ840_10235 [Streptomyces sp. NPDC047117]|uniref:hypothetical protein n=1 Tax=Streptomyces sp. NPDC047117 TaxID=3155379 RepID=UPI003404C6CE
MTHRLGLVGLGFVRSDALQLMPGTAGTAEGGEQFGKLVNEAAKGEHEDRENAETGVQVAEPGDARAFVSSATAWLGGSN